MLFISGVCAEQIGSDSSDASESPAVVKEIEEPTFTLVYAILGIIFVCIVFHTGYMKRN